MNSFVYDIPTKVYFGPGQLHHLGPVSYTHLVQELASFYRVLQAKTALMRGQLSP